MSSSSDRGEVVRLCRDLRKRGIRLTLTADQRIAVMPGSSLTASDRNRLRTLRSGVLSHLQVQRFRSETPFQFTWESQRFHAQRYVKQHHSNLKYRYGFDCETEIVVAPAIPRLALVTVSDGTTHLLIHPDDIGDFLLAHRGSQPVFHNAAFDFWVLHQHLSARNESEALEVLVDLVRRRRVHDTMLLDVLLRLAEDGENIYPRNLAVVAHEYAGLELDKEDPYRTRYSEIIGCDWSTVEPGFFTYAIKDAIATVRSHDAMRKKALCLLVDAGFDCDAGKRHNVHPDAVRRFRVLTESLQVGAAIALEAIGRNGVCTDRERLSKTATAHQRELKKLVRAIDRKHPSLFKKHQNGDFQRTGSGTPSKSTKVLDELLQRAVDAVQSETDEVIEIPRTPKGQISRSSERWKFLAKDSKFVSRWLAYEQEAKLSQYLRTLDADVLRPRYTIIERTGRTGCSKPNLQQVPRRDDFREVIVASSGHLLMIVDFKFIELVTLAAVCLTRFGRSRLAEIIRQGVDPHCYTAALLMGMEYAEFMELQDRKPKRFKKWRQLAKPVNFGVPGGMGAESLSEYARSTYGVEMTLQEAEDFRHRLVADVYPELTNYLGDTSMAALAKNLGTSEEALWNAFQDGRERSSALPVSVRKIVDGMPFKADGTPYSCRYVDRVWKTLETHNQYPHLANLIRARQGSPELGRTLFFTTVATLTGRLRSGVTYTSERNTQFQGLAADGAKIALTRLILAGFRVVGFVHDEILIELPDEGGYVRSSMVDDVLDHIRGGMEEVTCGIPVECEYSVSTCWSKRARLIRQKKRVYVWSPNVETAHSNDD